MPPALPEVLTHKVLYSSELVSLHDFRCKSGKCGATHEETTPNHSIVMPRRGVFVKHVDGKKVTADAASVMFFHAGRPYRVSHPCDCGDDCTSIVLAPAVIADALSGLDPARAEDPARPFAFTHGPSGAPSFLRQSRLVRALSHNAAAREFEVDEAVFRLVAGLLENVYGAWRGPGPGGVRDTTRRVRRDIVEAAKARLQTTAVGRVSLPDLAAGVHSSPFHLSRMFADHTGATISRYLGRVRVRHAATMICAGERDLSRVALSCGFCDQSHLTNVFRRELGIAPGTLRQEPELGLDIRKLIQE